MIRFCVLLLLLSACSEQKDNTTQSTSTTNATSTVIQKKIVDPVDDILKYDINRNKVSTLLTCKKTQETAGELIKKYTCIGGDAHTIKVTVEGHKDNNQLKQIALVWQEYIKDTGKGLHADKITATMMLNNLIGHYHVEDDKALKDCFLGQSEVYLYNQQFNFVCHYQQGETSNNHKIIITPKGL